MAEWIVPAEKELDEEEVAYLKDHGARELVRCKDCVKREYDNCPFNEFTMYKPADDFFCGAGSREWEEER